MPVETIIWFPFKLSNSSSKNKNRFAVADAFGKGLQIRFKLIGIPSIYQCLLVFIELI